jgi:hypothetical protein
MDIPDQPPVAYVIDRLAGAAWLGKNTLNSHLIDKQCLYRLSYRIGIDLPPSGDATIMTARLQLPQKPRGTNQQRTLTA